MADKLYFSRDTRVLVRIHGKNHSFEIPVLDGYSFSQATNSSEITLNEMADSDGNSRRARQMFNDSFAPAEWSFSTYAQPFYSAGTDQTAVEAPLWALLAGKAESTSTDSTKGKFRGVSSDSTTQYAGVSSDKWSLDFNQSNKTSLGVADIYFIMGAVNPSASDTILAYKISGCCVNEVSMDFDMEGMATLNWSGMGKEIVEEVIVKASTSPGTAGTVWYNTSTGNFNFIDPANGSTTVPTTKVESNNFIKNRLTKLTASKAASGTGTSTNLLNETGTFEIDVTEDEWNTSGNVTTIDLNAVAAPFDTGTNTADFVKRANSTAGTMEVQMNLIEAGEGRIATTGSTRYLFSAYIKRHALASPRYIALSTKKNIVGTPQETKGVVLDWNPTNSGQLPTFLNWSPGVTSFGNTGSTNVTNTQVTDEGNGWYRVSFESEAPPRSTVPSSLPQIFAVAAGNSVNLQSYAPIDATAVGTAGAGFYLAGFMVEPTSVGSNPASEVSYNGQTVASPATSYDLTITGGNVTINNNMSFLTPETLGQINKPLGHVTGTRSISGSFTCYLNEDGTSSANLFETLVGSNEVTNDFDLAFGIGDAGAGNQLPRVELNLANCHLEIPTHSIEDVISIETNFHALPTNINGKDELTVKYVADES